MSKKMVKVDAYLIPEDEAEEYIRKREFYAGKAAEIFGEFCHSVTRQWAGSEDGEAVTGLDEDGELMMLVHLDPYDIEMKEEADREGRLRDALLEHNEYVPEPGEECGE